MNEMFYSIKSYKKDQLEVNFSNEAPNFQVLLLDKIIKD
jgi:hypothetical protein